MGYKALSDIEIKFIIDNYEKLNYSQMAAQLKISKSKIVAQAIELQNQGILNNKIKRYSWTNDEEQKLITLLDFEINIIANKLNKKPESIVSKIKKLRQKGLIKRDYEIKFIQDTSNFSLEMTNWTKQEIDKLIQNIKSMGLIKLAQSLNKSTFDCIMKYYKIIEKNPIETYWNCKDYIEWSKEEDLYLVEHFPNSLRENIIANLTVKDWKKITRRAKMFGLKRDSYGTKYISPNERIVKQLLEELKINYTFQKRIDYSKNKFYIVDFIINDTNIILEAQGDYWHGNPKIHPNPSNTQLEKIASDKNRKKILEDLGYEVIYLWEYDLIYNYQQCKNIIKALPPV